jgi:hypothetical protein
MMADPGRRRLAWQLVIGAVLAGLLMTPAAAQPEPTAATSRAETPSAGPLSMLPTELRYLPNAKGELIPILRDANLDGYLEWLRGQQTNDTVQRPTFSVAAVELTGSSDEDLVTLKAILKIQITGSDRPVLVPIGLSEAVITRAVSRGNGRAMYGGKDRDQGYTWWFEGAGAYELEFDLLVSIRKASPWRRMPLSVPLAPVTSLQLRLPLRNAVVRTADDAVVEATPQPDGHTDVLVAGFGSRLELSWQPAVTASDQPASLDVDTSLLVRGSTGAFLIEATQYVKSLQGTFREFVVRLPPKGEMLQVDGAEVREALRDPDHPERITVQLNTPTAGPVTIKWQVRLVPSDRKRTVLEGFSVDGARRQSGEIGLLALDSARWTDSERNDPHLGRMNAGELRQTTPGGQVVRAFRFYGQPFSLPLQLEPVEPYFDLRPTLVLYADEDDLRLEARYDVRTFRGQLVELPFAWPGWRTEGWALEGFQPQGTIATGYTTDDADGSGRIVVRIADKTPESFQLRLIGRLLRRTPEETRISLPRSESPSAAPARLLLVHAENVDAELIARGETALRPVTGDAPPSSEDLGLRSGLSVREYRLDSDERALTVRVTPRPLHVMVDRRATLSIDSKRLSIVQQLNYQIEYDRLDHVLVATPAELAPSVNFRLGDRDVEPDWLPGRTPKERIARLRLSEPTLGQIAVYADWKQVLPDDLWNDRDATVSVPLLTPTQGEAEETRVECLRPAWFDVSTSDVRWELQHQDESATRWRTTGAADEFAALLSPASGEDRREFIATRANVRVQLERSGAQHYRYQVALSGQAPRVNAQLPKGAADIRFFWGSQPVPQREWLELPAGSGRFTIPTPELASAAEHWLTIDYTLAGLPPQMSARLVTRTPQLPQCRWAAQIVWQVQVPGDQHLFSYPATAAPLFKWIREGAIYRRISPSEGSPRGLLPEDRTPTVASTSARHRYAFSQFGAVQNLELRLLSTGATLFFGSGCSLLLGFVVLKAPWLRSLPTLLLLCCGILTAALWLMPQIELLLQPMLLGAGLVLLLGLFDAWNRRRLAGTVLTLSTTPSEFRVADPEAATAAHGLLIGSPDSATVFRAPPSSDSSRPRVPAESHVG